MNASSRVLNSVDCFIETQSFDYNLLHDPLVLSACFAWFGNCSLEALYETITRWVQGARPIDFKAVTYDGQSDRHNHQDSLLILDLTEVDT